jgi:hypothetical protein
MKRIAFILAAVVVLLLITFLVQNCFLLGVPFVQKGKTTSGDEDRLLGDQYVLWDGSSQGFGDFGREYLVRFGTFLFWTYDIEFERNQPSVRKGKVNGISWTKYMRERPDLLSLAQTTNRPPDGRMH